MPAFDPSMYVDVQERIVRFWDAHPDGSILTDLMSPPDDFNTCRYKATVYKHRDDKTPSATGYAFEIAGGSGANRTSHEENCETSAIGRALANMGYATTRENRPSRQEMQKAERGNAPVSAPAPRRDAQTSHQASAAIDADTSPLVNQGGINVLHGSAAKRNLNHQDVHNLVVARYNIDSVTKLTGKKLAELLNDLKTLGDDDLAELVLSGQEQEAGGLPGMPPSDVAAKHRS